MQSSLKKSLYLGLAALSFASVASVTANSSNANAAKKHAAAKKVTYTTDNKKLDQSVVFKATGKNAVYNKPVGKRSVKASLSDMKSKANSKSTNDLFMAYQEGHTSKGVHYYKVVSFDKKVRGFVYNKGVAKTNNTQEVAKPTNATGYLSKTRFFNQAYGTQFHNNNLKHNYDGMNIIADQFNIDKAVKVNNDQTYYYVKDTKNDLINGWVNSVYFSNNITKEAQDAQNSANAIHVNFVSDSNLGAVAFNKTLTPSNLTPNGTYHGNDVTAAVNSALIGTGYQLKNDLTDDVAKGTTISVVVKSGDPVVLTPSNFTATALNNAGNAAQAENTDGSNYVNTQKNQLSLSQAQWSQLFDGKANQPFDFNNFESALLTSGKAWNKFTDDKNGKVYTYDANLTKNSDANKALLDKNNSTLTFDQIAGNKNGFHIYYDVSNVNGTSKTSNGGVDNNTRLANAALDAYNNAPKNATTNDKVVAAENASGKNVQDLNSLVANHDFGKDAKNVDSFKNDVSSASNSEKTAELQKLATDYSKNVKGNDQNDQKAKHIIDSARALLNYVKTPAGQKSADAFTSAFNNYNSKNTSGSKGDLNDALNKVTLDGSTMKFGASTASGVANNQNTSDTKAERFVYSIASSYNAINGSQYKELLTADLNNINFY